MAFVMLSNLCKASNHPCNPRRKLSLEEIELKKKIISRSESKPDSEKNTGIIKNWL